MRFHKLYVKSRGTAFYEESEAKGSGSLSGNRADTAAPDRFFIRKRCSKIKKTRGYGSIYSHIDVQGNSLGL